MQTTTAKLYSLEYNNARTYGIYALFIAENILFFFFFFFFFLEGLNS